MTADHLYFTFLVIEQSAIYNASHLFSRASANAHLNLHKLASALVADLEEGLTRHVLNTGVGLMHKLKELVHDSLQKLPVVAQEAGILAHHVPEAACIFITDTGILATNAPPCPLSLLTIPHKPGC